jgi:hypothetical protein
MSFIMIEKIGAVSLRNGVIRMQCMATAADGTEQQTGELVIPAIAYGMVAGAFQGAAKQLRDKIEEARKAQEAQEGKKQGAATTH